MTVQRIQQPTNTGVGNQGQPASQTRKAGTAASFEGILRARYGGTEGIRFSAHAQKRIETGGLTFDGEALTRLERAVSAADQKGSRDALVLMDDLALLVSVSNRTVITAVEHNRRKTGVFTNIDSVVMA